MESGGHARTPPSPTQPELTATASPVNMGKKALWGKRPSEVALFPSLPSSKCIISARRRTGSQGVQL